MGLEKIGYRRVYYNINCIFADSFSVKWKSLLPKNITANIYIGPELPEPVFWTAMVPNPFLYNHPDTRHPLGPTAGDLENPSEGQTYTDITCIKEVKVPDDLSTRLRRGDPIALDTFAALSKLEFVADYDELVAASDLVAGTIALRYHRQLVMQLQSQNNVVANRYNGSSQSFWSGSKLELGIPLTLTSGFENVIKESVSNAVVTNENKWRFNSLALKWLLRAWEEQDEVIKFLSLFIPFEIILNQHKMQRKPEKLNLSKSIKQFLSSKYVGADKAALQSHLDVLIQNYVQKTSLAERFADFAEKANLPSKLDDIEAFGVYNKARNGIVHRGDTNIEAYLVSAKTHVYKLQDLTERYLSYAIYGDSEVYLNRARMSPEELAIVDSPTPHMR